jgi:MFS family permease
LAIPWLVLVTTGSPLKMGLVGLAQTLPYVIVGVLGSPIVGSYGVRKMAIHNDVASAVLIALIAAFAQYDFSLLLLLSALVCGVQGIGDKAKRMMLQPVVEAAGASLPRMVAVVAGRERVNTVVGVAAGGLVIAWAGPTGAIWINAISFAVSALMVIAFVPMPPEVEEADAKPTPEPYVHALARGFSFLRDDRLLFGIVAMMFMTNLFNQASGVVLIPLWVMDHFNSPVALGWVTSALALGAVLGNLLFIGLIKRLPRYLTFVLGYLLGGSPRFLVLGLSDDLLVVLAVTFLAGMAGSVINPVYGALLFERVPRAMQARVFGLAGAMTFGGIPLGGLVGAWFVQSFGLDRSLILSGLCYLTATLSPIIGYRIWKQMDNPPLDPEKPRGNAPLPLPDWRESLGLLSKRTLPTAVTGVLQAPIVVTLSYMDGSWTVMAAQGRHRIAPPAAISSAKVLQTVKVLDLPDLYETVELVHNADTAAIESRVRRLRDELAIHDRLYRGL